MTEEGTFFLNVILWHIVKWSQQDATAGLYFVGARTIDCSIQAFSKTQVGPVSQNKKYSSLQFRRTNLLDHFQLPFNGEQLYKSTERAAVDMKNPL